MCVDVYVWICACMWGVCTCACGCISRPADNFDHLVLELQVVMICQIWGLATEFMASAFVTSEQAV